MKKNILATVVAMSAAAAMLAGTAFADERTTFTVGFDAEYPPYGYMDENGEYTGFDLELAQAVCDLRGWELVKTPIAWDSKDAELDSGDIDCIWSGFTIDGREDDYVWSVPYVDNSQVVIVAEDSGITDLTGLEGKIVGVQADSAALHLLEEGGDQADLGATFGTLQEFADYNTAFAELQAGGVDAVAIDVGVAQYHVNDSEGFVILDEALNSEQYGIGFAAGNEELRDQVNESLMELVADGTYMELAEKYGLADMVCLTDSEEEASTEAVSEAVTEAASEEAAEAVTE